jgi:hypothetical protein
MDAQKMADFLGISLKRMAESLDLNYKAFHRNPSAATFQEALQPLKRILELLHEFFSQPRIRAGLAQHSASRPRGEDRNSNHSERKRRGPTHHTGECVDRGAGLMLSPPKLAEANGAGSSAKVQQAEADSALENRDGGRPIELSNVFEEPEPGIFNILIVSHYRLFLSYSHLSASFIGC